MLEIGKIIVKPVHDDRAVFYLACVISVWRRSTHGFGESECEETDSSHELQDDTEETHFLTPGSLLFGTTDACGGGYQRQKIEVRDDQIMGMGTYRTSLITWAESNRL